jgi:hypothetical protein
MAGPYQCDFFTPLIPFCPFLHVDDRGAVVTKEGRPTEKELPGFIDGGLGKKGALAGQQVRWWRRRESNPARAKTLTG